MARSLKKTKIGHGQITYYTITDSQIIILYQARENMAAKFQSVGGFLAILSLYFSGFSKNNVNTQITGCIYWFVNPLSYKHVIII